MAPRLAHTKSRLGCQKCKERRIKCDEVHPTCGSCRAHHIDCLYIPKPTRSAHNSNLTKPHSPTHTLAGGTQRRLSELRLLHHFITAVAPTLPTRNTAGKDMWGTSIVELALQPCNSFLLHAIFAVSALHWTVLKEPYIPGTDPWPTIPTLAPSTTRTSTCASLEDIGLDLHKAHRLYLDLCVQEHRMKIAHAQTDATYLTSILMLLTAMRINAVQAVHEYNSASVQWRRMSRALHNVDMSEYGPLANDAWKAISLDEKQRETLEIGYGERMGWDGREICGIMQEILALEDEDSVGMTKVDRDAYEGAARYIAVATVTAAEGLEDKDQITRRLMAFPAEAPERFIELLEAKKARGFAMFTHMMAVARYVDRPEEMWWMEGVAWRCRARHESMLPQRWLWALPKLY